jgi:hypothetical protein
VAAGPSAARTDLACGELHRLEEAPAHASDAVFAKRFERLSASDPEVE